MSCIMFQIHSENLRALDRILIHQARSVKAAIRANQDVSRDFLTRVYALILGAWAECRLCKLLSMRTCYSQSELRKINNARTVQMKWERIVEVSFKKHYMVRKINSRTIGHTAYMQYEAISEVLNLHLYPIILLRNKLAHGQFKYPLNSSKTAISTELMQSLNTENIMTLQYKRAILGHVIDMIECLVVSRPAFERDFDRFYSMILETKQRLENQSFSEYVQKLKS